MPLVSEIIYSRDATVQAVRDYFRFLVAMYLDESEILEPPEHGWDTINPNGWPNFDKTEEVIELLRYLPYIDEGEIAPECEFVKWHMTPADMDGEDIREATEPYPDEATIPPHIVGLTIHSQYGLMFLLDTELGVIYWRECHGEAKSAVPEVEDDPYDWVDDDLIPEDQVEWRAGSGIWEIEDFFEMLKLNFKTLNFIPISPREVKADWVACGDEGREMLDEVKKIYKNHGWPDLTRYRKEDCLAAIEAMLKTRDQDSGEEEEE